MFYNFFVSGTQAAGLAQSIVNVIVKRFNIVGDVASLLSSLTYKLKVIYRSFDGDFSWADMGGALFDVGQLILTFVPAGRIWDIVAALWDISTLF